MYIYKQRSSHILKKIQNKCYLKSENFVVIVNNNNRTHRDFEDRFLFHF